MLRISEECMEEGIRRLSETQGCQDSIHCLWGMPKKGDKNCQYPDERLCPLLKFKWELEGMSPAFMGYYQKASKYNSFKHDYTTIELEGDEAQKQEVRSYSRDLHRFRQISLVELSIIHEANEGIPYITKEMIEETLKGFSLEAAHKELLEAYPKLIGFLDSLFESMETGRREDYKYFNYLFFKVFLEAIDQQAGVMTPLLPTEEKEFFQKVEEHLEARRG